MPIAINITKLLANQPYSISVKAYTSPTTFNQSDSVQIQTLSEPDNITVVDVSSQSLQIHWKPHRNITRYVLEYEEINSENKMIVVDSDDGNANRPMNVSELFLVENLQPKTRYRFSILLYFVNRPQAYLWPQDSRFIFETHGDCPSAPGKPVIRHVRDAVYKVAWEPSKDNGATIIAYSLEGWHQPPSNRVKRSTLNSEADTYELPVKSEFSLQFDSLNYTKMVTTTPLSVEDEDMPDRQWVTYYNGTDTYWIIQDTVPIAKATFRVRALNSYGWGMYSVESDATSEAYNIATRDNILFAVFIPALIILLIVVAFFIIYGKCSVALRKNKTNQSFIFI